MADVTDSYCERCGARYVFNANASKGFSLKRAGLFAKGLKNFVLTDGQSMADSLASARLEDDHADSTRMTELFHKTFNLCMGCRQYACDRCWNPTVGACLSCAPLTSADAGESVGQAIGQTPAAGSNAKWPFLQEAAATQPASGPDSPFAALERARLTDSRWQVQPQPDPPAAWPAADLPAADTATMNGSTQTVEQHPVRGPVDDTAARAWPITDEIAPEMALTPEELTLVETQLSPPPIEPDTAEDQAIREPEFFQPRGEPSFASRPATVAPEMSEWEGATWNALAARVDALRSAAQAPSDSLQDETEPGRGLGQEPEPEFMRESRSGVEPEGGIPEHGRVLRMPLASPDLPPLTVVTPQPQTRERTPLVARLFGRHETARPQPRRLLPPDGAPAGDPWPTATPWKDRPLEPHDLPSMPEAMAHEALPSDGLHPAPGPTVARLAAAAPNPEPLPAAAPDEPDATAIPLLAAPPSIDPRTAAVERLAAVSADVAPHDEPSPEQEYSFWPDAQAQREAQEPTPEEPFWLVGPGKLMPAEQAPTAPVQRTRPSVPSAPAMPDFTQSAQTTALVAAQAAAAMAAAQGAQGAQGAATRPTTGAEAAGQPAEAPQAFVPGPVVPFPPRPAMRPPLFDGQRSAPAQPPEVVPPPVAWPEADTEVADSLRARSVEVPDAGQARRPEDAAALQIADERQAADSPQPPQWPPLGSSWNSRETPKAPWPGPAAAPVPAILAAQQAAALPLAEMWAQSAEELLNRGSVRVCQRCALPVSTHARFCRRCGTKQA